MWGTCWESFAGGHHFRAWRQNGTLADSGAWFVGYMHALFVICAVSGSTRGALARGSFGVLELKLTRRAERAGRSTRARTT
jgi:hypothetical protein